MTSPKKRGRMDMLRVRARMIDAIRSFFSGRDYLEVETPLRIPAPAPETHIDAIPSGDWFLHTSPELCMKRLVAAGFPKIFQICKCFRAGERGHLHLPEFTMLEWYCAGMDYHGLMEECEALFLAVAAMLGYEGPIHYQDMEINLQSPWKRLTVKEVFSRHASMSVAEAMAKGCFDEIMAMQIEPRLGNGKPVFLYDYPAEFGALARKKRDDPDIAERFEIYIGGLELANGFSELTDAEEQRQRFILSQKERLSMQKTIYPLPERFLDALSDMPATAGIALGIERMAMIFTGANSIDELVTFTPESL